VLCEALAQTYEIPTMAEIRLGSSMAHQLVGIYGSAMTRIELC